MGIAYWPDIRHDTLGAVSGPAYGEPARYMKRSKRRFTIRLVFSRFGRRARIVVWGITTFAKWLRYGGTMCDDES